MFSSTIFVSDTSLEATVAATLSAASLEPLIISCCTPGCIGLLAYPEAVSAPPESQLLLHPSFKHRTASLVNLALIQANHPSCCDLPISSSPLTDALAATVALQKIHLDACWGRGLTFELRAQNEVQFSEVLMQQIRRTAGATPEAATRHLLCVAITAKFTAGSAIALCAGV